MGDFEAPSFSLGFDFDFDDLPEPRIATTPPNEETIQPNTLNRVPVAADDDEFEIETLTVADTDDENEELLRPRLKRLRRGCSSGLGKSTGSGRVDLGSVVVDDDEDIEDFSSREDNNAKVLRVSGIAYPNCLYDFESGGFKNKKAKKTSTKKK